MKIIIFPLVLILENLKHQRDTDRYQYILPYYNFDTVFSEKFRWINQF